MAAALLTEPYGFNFIFITPNPRETGPRDTRLRAAARQRSVRVTESKKEEGRSEVSVCVFRSQSHPIYFLFVCVCVWGGIVLETAPFLDAIITQARPRSQA